MSKTEKLNEEQVFKQELDDEELKAVTGGDDKKRPCDKAVERHRQIDGCAATVEVDSNCWDNDRCYVYAVKYKCSTNVAKAQGLETEG